MKRIAVHRGEASWLVRTGQVQGVGGACGAGAGAAGATRAEREQLVLAQPEGAQGGTGWRAGGGAG
eukprot:1727769-Rhodomonas_salina.1